MDRTHQALGMNSVRLVSVQTLLRGGGQRNASMEASLLQRVRVGKGEAARQRLTHRASL